MQDKVLITPDGKTKLENELKKLKDKDRPEVIAAIATGRADGDLSENASYQTAKEQQNLIEGRIAMLEGMLSRLQIVDVSQTVNTNTVRFGATVTLVDLDTNKKMSLQIVGEYEADFNNGKISITSPLGKACITKVIGDVVTVNAPSGNKEYEIITITYK
jgi:transcription elongation factor GreA